METKRRKADYELLRSDNFGFFSVSGQASLSQ